MFSPDYRNLQRAACNLECKRFPLYEHIVNIGIAEQILGRSFGDLFYGSYADKKEYFRSYCEFFQKMGYDTISFEVCIGRALIDGGALGCHKKGVIQTREDFERYPFDEIPRIYRESFDEHFRALKEALPPGMKAVGGVGNGVFELVQDLVGYMDLCYMSEDDPELYADLFARVGRMSLTIWEDFMKRHSDAFCVLRFGDDLGFKSNTLISAADIRTHVIPAYKPIIDLVHRYEKPFLLHSCGNIFSVMEDLIGAGINAKHSNEDQIAPFPVWVEKYGDRIGNFGGIDTDAVCRLTKPEMKEYISEVVAKSKGHGGFAFGSGNSIPLYVPVSQYITMNEVVREIRGE
jgi:uroporphyrinogen decarboxylase